MLPRLLRLIRVTAPPLQLVSSRICVPLGGKETSVLAVSWPDLRSLVLSLAGESSAGGSSHVPSCSMNHLSHALAITLSHA